MKVYKWTIKKNNRYITLRKFSIDGIHNSKNKNDITYYEKNKIYKTNCEFKTDKKLTNEMNRATHIKGFHFWKTKSNIWFERYNKCLKHYNEPEINCILECEVPDNSIFAENDFQIVASEFKIIDEIK